MYAPAIEYGYINYSSTVEDTPLRIDIDADNELEEWPVNFTGVYQDHPVTVQWALMVSANALRPTLAIICSASKTASIL